MPEYILRTGYAIKELNRTPSSICSAHLLRVAFPWFEQSEAAAALRLEWSMCVDHWWAMMSFPSYYWCIAEYCGLLPHTYKQNYIAMLYFA